MAIRSPWPCRLFLFDLDGTLIDSKADITQSVNLALRRMHLAPIPVARISTFVGEGVQRLLYRSLCETTGTEPSGDRIQEGVTLFKEEYGHHLLDSTRLYPGVRETLATLSWATFGIVTNKPESFSHLILKGLGLDSYFSIVLGGDSMPDRKPDPAPLRAAMERCGVLPRHTVMVGDSSVDVAAGLAAGAITCGISSGFRGHEELDAAGCDVIVESFSEIPNHFCRC